jgi:NADH dehydrogenase/NADH:ubiquinone oxidoreductase subunit G
MKPHVVCDATWRSEDKMQEITLTINGQSVKGKSGDTVLEICRANDIYIPTLCHLDGLTDVGACRLCVVEIQSERKPVPACNYPARDGLVIKTNTPQIEKYRKQVIELMFAERNHFCMYCEQSGDCELQQMAYRYQMDNVRFQGLFPVLPLDTLSEFLAIDHNRCILCGRCVRVCKEVAALRTLDFGGRGGQTMIAADINQPLGESSCTLCGSCLQACPTGAIINKASVYKGKVAECKSTDTLCQGCDIGCEIRVMTKDENLVRIETPDRKTPRGPLCKIGRFEQLTESRARINSPLMRNAKGELKTCTMDEALNAVAKKFAELGNGCGALTSTRLPSETINTLQKLVKDTLKSKMIDTIDGKDYRLISSGIRQYNNNGATPEVDPDIEGILKADCIMVIGANIDRSHPVIGNLIRRAVSQNHAKLIVVDSNQDVFPLWSDLWLKPETGTDRALINGLSRIVINNNKQLTESNSELCRVLSLYEADKVTAKTSINETQLQSAAKMLGQSKNFYIISGNKLSEQNDADLITALLNLSYLVQNGNGNNLNLIFLKQSINSQGAWDLGIAGKDIKTQKPRGLYLLLSDDKINNGWVEWLKGIDYLVVQASYHSPVVDLADVVLPSLIWAERSGSYVTAGKRAMQAHPVIQRSGSLTDEEILQKLIQKINVTSGRS